MNKRIFTLVVAIACLLMLPVAALAQLPATTYGWNLGNTLEPSCGEGCWAPAVTQQMINAVAAEGFNAIRIPVAWNSHANQQNQIDPAWLARVKQVVDWSLAANMHVIINNHWDDGWFDNNRNCGRFSSNLNSKFQSFWTQIANTFVNSDSRLIFCAANEPDIRSQAEMDALLQYYQTFVNAVRATGGNNTTRWLILPGPSTDIEKSFSWFNTMPSDPTPGRLMIDVHYYGPWNYTGLTSDASWGDMFYFWGQAYHTSDPNLLNRNPNWGEEDFMTDQIQKMKTKFANNGIPVIFGEFGAIKRTENPDLTANPTEMARHRASRTFYNREIVTRCNQNGFKPFYWDEGWNGADGFAIFDRVTTAVTDQGVLDAVTGGAALPPPGGGGGCTATQTHVDALVTVVTGNGPNKRGRATITVTDNCGNPVAGATVTGNFTGTFNESGRTGVTNSSGVATITTNGKSGGTPSVTFCVTNITASGLTYNSSANVLTCDTN
jgi:endoglucanase